MLSKDRLIVLGVSLLALATLVGGILLGGSPMQARRQKRDEQRQQLIQSVHYALEGSFLNASSTVPTSTQAYTALLLQNNLGDTYTRHLADLHGWPEYRSLATDQYELCMTFETASTNWENSSYRYIAPYPVKDQADFWNHKAERTCWILTIPDVLRAQKP